MGICHDHGTITFAHNGYFLFCISALVEKVCFTTHSPATLEALLIWFSKNVLRATTACTFSTSQLPKVVRSWCVLYILTSKSASRHNNVQFFISHLASWLRTRRFSEPTFRPSGATNHWKNTVNRDFPTFSRICIFFLLTLSLLLFSLLIFLFSLPLPFSAFHLSILSEVWLLNFLRWLWFSRAGSIQVTPRNPGRGKERHHYLYLSWSSSTKSHHWTNMPNQMNFQWSVMSHNNERSHRSHDIPSGFST